MAEHAWTTEYVDGGTVDGTFWTCPTCGVSGGPVWWPKTDKTLLCQELNNGRWPAFIPGVGAQYKLSEDCQEAQAQIRAYLLDERLATMRKKWCKPHAEILAKMVKEAPEGKNLMPILALIFSIEMPVNRGHCISLAELREKLKVAGFE